MRSWVVVALLWAFPSFGQTTRDYSLMSHRVFIDSLRAGNHDESGINEYYFTLQLSAVRNTKDDLVKEWKDRPLIDQDPVEFGDVKVPVLSSWDKTDRDPAEVLFVDVKGDEMRTIVANAMRTFKVKESEVAMVGMIELWERNKIMGYFGEDQKISSIKYYPIPASEYHAAVRTNIKLEIVDDQGTQVSVKIRYENPRKNPSTQTSENTAGDSVKESSGEAKTVESVEK